MKTYHAESARAGLEAASRAGLTSDDFSTVAMELLERAIPYDAMCIGTTDPATRLSTGAVKVNMAANTGTQFAEHEYGVPDFNLFVDLADRPMAVGILADATGGDNQRSARIRDLQHLFSTEHEMRGVLRTGDQMWGTFAMYREPGRSGFSPAEAEFMHRTEKLMAIGMQRGLIATDLTRPERSNPSSAVLIFDQHGEVVSATPGAEQRIVELGGDLWSQLPFSVAAVVSAARAQVEDVVPRSRLRSAGGEWLELHAAPIRGRDGLTGQIAVTIDAAGPPKVIPLIVAAFGLTSREQDVIQQVLRGDSTSEIAAALHLSPYTVQDHLKMIFEKVGVSSRRELSSRIFFSHYANQSVKDAGMHQLRSGSE
ncbi:helix-turn-helix transcriptional regulator [Streptomyces sp. SID13031]|uniref:LuxR C-terminal-related transcriptional regulator n=1 Tax=Streptomyces sp. SID13031 TaxID=2706046 RepID=UPI0013C54D73|nr:helix-turn-helix transcriptional regulator [Streptomyces sp. SID13031]